MKGKVLIVDDNSELRNLLAELLRDQYQVSQADSGAALQKIPAENQPDVILLDVRLPDANGLELLPQIKKRWADTEVIVLTGAPPIPRPSPGRSMPPSAAPSISSAKAWNSTGRSSLPTSTTPCNTRSKTKKTTPCARRLKP